MQRDDALRRPAWSVPGPQQRLENAAAWLTLRAGKLAWERAAPARSPHRPTQADSGAHRKAGEAQLFALLFTHPPRPLPSALGELGTWGHPHPLGTHRLVGWGTGGGHSRGENFTKALRWALGLGGCGGCCQGEKVVDRRHGRAAGVGRVWEGLEAIFLMKLRIGDFTVALAEALGASEKLGRP